MANLKNKITNKKDKIITNQFKKLIIGTKRMNLKFVISMMIKLVMKRKNGKSHLKKFHRPNTTQIQMIKFTNMIYHQKLNLESITKVVKTPEEVEATSPFRQRISWTETLMTILKLLRPPRKKRNVKL